MRKEVVFILVLGNNDTGKSTVIKSFADSWLIKNPYGYFAAFDPQKRFPQKHIDIKTQEDFADLKGIKNSLVIIDDFKKAWKKQAPPDWLVDLMADRYEDGNDIVIILHGPKQIIEYLTTYEDLYLLFNTNYKEKDLQQRLPSPYIISKALEIIQDEYRNNGSGNYPIFPHVMVDVNKNLITKINFQGSPEYGKKISIF